MASSKLKPPSCGVFFGNLHAKVTDKHLLELGSQAGPVLRASRSKDSVFGFVEYADVESAIYCVGLYHGLLKLFGQQVNVNFSNSPVDQLKPQEQTLLERCTKLIDAALSSNSNVGAGAVRRGGREAQRYTPYGDARGHREQRASMKAPTRFNDDYEDASYGSSDAAAGYGCFGGHEPAQAYGRAGAAAAGPVAPLDAGAVAAMHAAAAAAAAAAGLGQQPVAVQAGGWHAAAAPAATPVQLQRAPSSGQVVVVQQAPPAAQLVYQHPQAYQQPQQYQYHQPKQQQQQQQQPYQVVQQASQPAAAPLYHQPHQHQQYQVDPATAAYQQWHQQQQAAQQQQRPPYYQAAQQQGQSAVQQQVQYIQPVAAPVNGAFQSSVPVTLQGQYQVQVVGGGQQQQQPPQQQAVVWYQ